MKDHTHDDRTTYERNRQTVQGAVATGASVREIADELDCSTSTAHRCRQRARRELGHDTDE